VVWWWLAWLLMILHKCLLFLLLWRNEGQIVRCRVVVENLDQ
jgi:HAMP domain-containing protein